MFPVPAHAEGLGKHPLGPRPSLALLTAVRKVSSVAMKSVPSVSCTVNP